MNLTKYHKDAFVTAVMNDVPKVDYEEQIRVLAREAFLTLIPEEVRPLWHHNKTRPFVRVATLNLGKGLGNFSVPYQSNTYLHSESLMTLPTKYRNKLNELIQAAVNQQEERRGLAARLEGVVNGCRTRKQLATALPEFEKYLPAEAKKGTNLPVLANVVTDFMKAGWPKGQQPQAKAA